MYKRQILHRNYRWGHNEIDIVALKQNTLIFVEVKTRNSAYFGLPESAITLHKQKQLIKAANAYVKEFKRTEEVQFDVVSVILNNKTQSTKHIKDAFYAT